MKKYYDEINILRGIAVLLVLLGHSFPDAQTGIANPIANYIHSLVYSFHMPLFFMISGFVFKPAFDRLETVDDKKKAIFKKAKRLLVPYFTYSLVTFVLKLVFQKFANNAFEFGDLYKILLGENPNGGLWFLWVLFFIFVVLICFNKVNIYVLLGAALILSIGTDYIQGILSGFGSVIFYSRYFIIGMIINQYYDKVHQYVDTKKWIGFLTGAGLLALQFCTSDNGLLVYMLIMLKALLGITTMYLIALAVRKETKPYKMLSVSAKYSMDIYLLSYFVQVPIRVIAVNFIAMPYLLICLLMFVFGGVIPVLVSSKIVRKNKVLSLLLIGN